MSFLTRKPWALALAREPEAGRSFPVSRRARIADIYVLRGAGRIRCPRPGTARADAVAAVSAVAAVFAAGARLRIALEPLIPPRRPDADESLGQFVRRRLGAEALRPRGRATDGRRLQRASRRAEHAGDLPTVRRARTHTWQRHPWAARRQPCAASISVPRKRRFPHLRCGQPTLVDAWSRA